MQHESYYSMQIKAGTIVSVSRQRNEKGKLLKKSNQKWQFILLFLVLY